MLANLYQTIYYKIKGIDIIIMKNQFIYLSLIHIYNYIYNEIGKKEYKNPFFLDAKIELAGNLLSLVSKKNQGASSEINSKTALGIPVSQFVKFDIDVRKYFTFKNKHQFIVRQLIGVGTVSYTHLDVYKRQFYCLQPKTNCIFV